MGVHSGGTNQPNGIRKGMEISRKNEVNQKVKRGDERILPKGAFQGGGGAGRYVSWCDDEPAREAMSKGGGRSPAPPLACTGLSLPLSLVHVPPAGPQHVERYQAPRRIRPHARLRSRTPNVLSTQAASLYQPRRPTEERLPTSLRVLVGQAGARAQARPLRLWAALSVPPGRHGRQPPFPAASALASRWSWEATSPRPTRRQ